jgi:hypothetical protein
MIIVTTDLSGALPEATCSVCAGSTSAAARAPCGLSRWPTAASLTTRDKGIFYKPAPDTNPYALGIRIMLHSPYQDGPVYTATTGRSTSSTTRKAMTPTGETTTTPTAV